jgi:hypothetical protein
MKSKDWSEVREFRYGIGAEILEQMSNNEDLPLPNIYLVAEVMDKYFKKHRMVMRVKKAGYRWVPDSDYWRMTIRDISEYMRTQDNKYFGFVREGGKLSGVWKFMDKEEWEYSLRWDHKAIGTRVDNHNEKIDDSVGPYTVQIPRIKPVPALQ